jgi:serine/threonine protein kinase
LEHTAIVSVYDFGEHENCPFLVMRLMRGGTLVERIKERLFSLDETIVILKSIVPAIEEAHAKGIVHRDLKPANILFDTHGHAFLSDFGIVKDAKERQSITSSNVTIGTPGYMSPEHIDGSELDGRSDIYMLGVIVFRMLTGHLPFEDKMPLKLIHKQMNEPTPDIRTFLPDFPPSGAKVIANALEKKPENRYKTASKFLDAFEKAFHPQPTSQSALFNDPEVDGGTQKLIRDEDPTTLAFDSQQQYWQKDGRLIPVEPYEYSVLPTDVIVLPNPSLSSTEHYESELRAIRRQAEKLAHLQRQALEERHPPYNDLLSTISQGQIWKSRPEEEQFLKARVGRGPLPASFTFQYQPGFRDNAAAEIVEQFETINSLPLVVDLNRLNKLYITGSSPRQMANTILLNLAAHHAPEFVTIFAIAQRQTMQSHWHWLKWLPHTSALVDRGRSSNLTSTQGAIEAVLELLSAELQRRQIELDRVANIDTSTKWPHLVILVDEIPAVFDDGKFSSLLNSGQMLKTHAIILGEPADQQNGSGLLEINNDHQVTITKYEPDLSISKQSGEADLINSEEAEVVARRIAPVKLVGPDLSSVEPERRCRFSKLFGSETIQELNVQQLYRESFLSDGIITPVGLNAFGNAVNIQFVKGHNTNNVLVCGESETERKNLLKTIILGLGTIYSPKQLRLIAASLGTASSQDDLNISIPHLRSSRLCTNETEVAALQTEIWREIVQRQNLFNQLASRISHPIPDLATYNHNMQEATLSQIILIVDGYTADWHNAWHRFLTKISEDAPNTGLYLIFGLQDSNGISDEWLASFPVRLCLRLYSTAASNQIIGQPSATHLSVAKPGLGYKWQQEKSQLELFQTPDLNIPRLQEDSAVLDNYSPFSVFTVLPDGSRELLLHQGLSDLPAKNRTEADLIADQIKACCRQIGYIV